MLTQEAERVALDGGLWVDVGDFTTVADAASTPAPANLPTLQAAVDLYTADFLAGFTLPGCPDFDEWQAFQAERLRQSLRVVLERLSWACAAAGVNSS